MQDLFALAGQADADIEVASFGVETVMFQPAAARCSCSSSTCCCW